MEKRNLLALTLLLLAGCVAGPRDPVGRAAFEGDVPRLGALLDAGGSVDGEGGITPLMWAARAGRVEAIRLLAARGANLEARGGVNDWTPLLHAIHKNQEGAVVVLLEAGAKATGPDGDRAIALAAGYAQVTIVRTLLRHGADARGAMTAAVHGVFDLDVPRSTCGMREATVRALIEADPTARPSRDDVAGSGCPSLASL